MAGLNSCFVVCIYVLFAAMLSFYSFAFLLFPAYGVCVNYLFLLPQNHGNLFFASYLNTLFLVFSVLCAFLSAFRHIRFIIITKFDFWGIAMALSGVVERLALRHVPYVLSLE